MQKVVSMVRTFIEVVVNLGVLPRDVEVRACTRRAIDRSRTAAGGALGGSGYAWGLLVLDRESGEAGAAGGGGAPKATSAIFEDAAPLVALPKVIS